MPQRVENLLGREFLGSRRRGADFNTLLKAGNTNFEKLVKIGAGDAQKTQALKERHLLIVGLC